jgi:hypothetical protein
MLKNKAFRGDVYYVVIFLKTHSVINNNLQVIEGNLSGSSDQPTKKIPG